MVSIKEKFGGRVRVRVCGLCWQGADLLLVNHFGLYNRPFWAPPGGGLEFGQNAPENLTREFKEETGLIVRPAELKFVCEFLSLPLHAIELYYEVSMEGGTLARGKDPEMGDSGQIIKEVRFVAEKELFDMPAEHRHGLFRGLKSYTELKTLTGYRLI